MQVSIGGTADGGERAKSVAASVGLGHAGAVAWHGPLLPVAGANLAAGRVHFHWLSLLCLVLLGTLGTGYAYLLSYRTLQEDGATAASLVTYLIPIVGVTAGVLVLGEPFRTAWCSAA
jgi:drug/metabolite transporter (DMT)-like permease